MHQIPPGGQQPPGGGGPPQPPQPGPQPPPGGQPAPPQPPPGQPDPAQPEPANFDPTDIVDDGVITSPFRPPHRPAHDGVDIDTPADGDDVEVHTPVAGTVEFIGGNYGTVNVRDAQGYLHQLLHLDRATVVENQVLEAGDAVGIMGGRGPQGANQYDDHVHYQVRDPEDDLVDPEADYPFYDEEAAADQGDGPGDPPGADAGPGSYGGEAGQDDPPPPAGGPPPPGDQPPPPPDLLQLPRNQPAPPDADRPGASEPPLAGEARRLMRLEQQVAALHAAGPPAQALVRARTLAAVECLAGRLELADLTAREAKGLSLALLGARGSERHGGPLPDTGAALRLAAYAGRATAYELSARVLAARATRLADILSGGGRDAAGS